MAFQAGTQVRPELGRADLSGFERSGQYIGQALANLGAQIGGAIKDKREKKEEARLSKQAAEMVLGLSDQYGLGIDNMDDAKTAVEVFGGGKNAVVTLSALAKSFQPDPEVPSTVSSSEMKNYLDIVSGMGFNAEDLYVRDGELYHSDVGQDTLLTQGQKDMILSTEAGRNFVNRSQNRYNTITITGQKPTGTYTEGPVTGTERAPVTGAQQGPSRTGPYPIYFGM